MEFWGAEVKVGETVKVDPTEFEACLHLSQAALGESKKDKSKEPVVLYLKVGEQKFVLGTLSREKIPQIPFELVLEKEFELSHNSKSASVHFCGYKAYYPDEESDEDDFSESDEDIPVLNAENVYPETKAEERKDGVKKPAAKAAASAKQVKVVDPKQEEEGSEDDSDDDDFETSDDEMEDADSDDDSESEDDEETPAKKVDQGKKRRNESASKAPVLNKKAKNVAPEKTATPHPNKKGGKTPNSDAKNQTPKSGGQFTCNSCSKTFNSDGGLQQHNKAKHGQ